MRQFQEVMDKEHLTPGEADELQRFFQRTLDDADCMVTTPSASEVSSDSAAPVGTATPDTPVWAQQADAGATVEPNDKFSSQRVHLQALTLSLRQLQQQRVQLLKVAAEASEVEVCPASSHCLASPQLHSTGPCGAGLPGFARRLLTAVLAELAAACAGTRAPAAWCVGDTQCCHERKNARPGTTARAARGVV